MKNNANTILKNIYNLKAKNSSTSIGSNSSNPKMKNAAFTYDIDKKDKSVNTIENSISLKDLKTKESSGWNYPTNYNKINQIYNKYYKHNPMSVYKNQLYSLLNVNKAPTLYDNRLEINKIIRKKKLQKEEDYNNFYKNVMSTYSKLRRNNSQISSENLKTGNLYNTKYKNNSNRSCDDIMLMNPINIKKINSSNISGNNYEENITDNFPGILNNNNNDNKKIKESTIIDGQLTENKDYFNNSSSVMMTLLPYISRTNGNSINNNENSAKYTKRENDDEDEVKLSNFAIQKMRNHLFEAMECKTRTVSQFANLENKIRKLKIFQNIHYQNLQKILDSEKFNIDKKYKYLMGINKIYNNVWSKYRKTINLYLHFLFDKQDEMEINLERVIRKKKNIESQIEKLMIQNVKVQKDLEDLVQMRNFLLQVKQKLIKQPHYFTPLLHRDSRKIELGNIILKSLVGTKNSSVIKFLDSFSILNLVQLYEIHPSNSTMKLIRKKMNNRTILPKEYREKYIYEEHLLKDKNNYIPEKGEVLFENVDQFLIIYQNLEQKNLLLLKQNNDIKNYTGQIMRKYESMFEDEIDEKQSQIYLDLIEKTEKLEKVKERNKVLQDRYNSITSLEFNDNNNYTKKLIQIHSKSSFIDMNFFKMINYLKILKEYPHHGVLLLEKLISIIKGFLSFKYGDYDIERCYNLVGMVNLDLILKMNKKSFNENNKFMVYDYILKLVKIYDDICQYVKNKQKLYESNRQNKEFMRKKREEVQTLRKVNNAREIRQLLEDKRVRNIELILDKWKKPINKKMRKVNDKFDSHLNNNKRNKSVEEIEQQRKLKLLNEFRDLISYD